MCDDSTSISVPLPEPMLKGGDEFKTGISLFCPENSPVTKEEKAGNEFISTRNKEGWIRTKRKGRSLCHVIVILIDKEKSDYECIIIRVGLTAMSEVLHVFIVFNVIFIKPDNKVSICFNRKPFPTGNLMFKRKYDEGWLLFPFRN